MGHYLAPTTLTGRMRISDDGGGARRRRQRSAATVEVSLEGKEAEQSERRRGRRRRVWSRGRWCRPRTAPGLELSNARERERQSAMENRKRKAGRRVEDDAAGAGTFWLWVAQSKEEEVVEGEVPDRDMYSCRG